MRRARIRLRIAKAIEETLPMGFTLSLSNVRRYVTRDRLTEYNIRRDTPIHSTDWTAATSVARELRRNRKSTIEQDRELLLKRNLADVMRKHYERHPRGLSCKSVGCGFGRDRPHPPASTGIRD